MAIAKPRVAVAPLEGDTDNDTAEIVAKEADDHAKVTAPKTVAKSMDKLGLTNPLASRELEQLRTRLEVDIVIHGKLEREGHQKRLELTVSGRGKHAANIRIKFKTANGKFRKELRSELVKQIDEVMGGEGDSDDDDEPKKKPPLEEVVKRTTEDDRPKKHVEEDRPKKHVADDDSSTHVRKHAADDDDDDRRHRKHRHHDNARDPLTQAAFLGDAGGSFARRTLTYPAVRPLHRSARSAQRRASKPRCIRPRSRHSRVRPRDSGSPATSTRRSA